MDVGLNLVEHLLSGVLDELNKQNWNFRPKSEGRSGRRALLLETKLNILEDITSEKAYHSVITLPA